MEHHLEENRVFDPRSYEMVTWVERDEEREKEDEFSRERDLDRLSHLKEILR